MPTHIIQDDSDERTILRVEGEMTREDALLLEKIALELRGADGRNVIIDLADLAFLDSESAGVLKRLMQEHKFEISGMEIFLQSAVNVAERNAG